MVSFLSAEISAWICHPRLYKWREGLGWQNETAHNCAGDVFEYNHLICNLQTVVKKRVDQVVILPSLWKNSKQKKPANT